tara:strand:+ start:2418 stop:2663 length:246 start_codon:yes stop_codon:yes gene_type:complete
MKGSLHRRISVSTFWASTRISVLDGFEQYEDSYAITQEFREWITCDGDHPDQLNKTLLTIPKFLRQDKVDRATDPDQMLEI